MTNLSLVWRVVVDILLVFFIAVLFFYLPVRVKTRRSWRMALFIFGGIFLLFTQWVVIEDYQCNQSFQPELVNDFNQQITTKEQASNLLQDYILQEYFPSFDPTKVSNEVYTKEKETKKRQIEERVQQEGNTFGTYYGPWRFILHQDGKLYRDWEGD